MPDSKSCFSLGKCATGNRCPVPIAGSHICNESNTLDAVKTHRDLYENVLKKVVHDKYGESSKKSDALQQDWLRDLSDLTDIFSDVVVGLEQEATEKCRVLESMSNGSYQSINESTKQDASISVDPHELGEDNGNYGCHLQLQAASPGGSPRNYPQKVYQQQEMPQQLQPSSRYVAAPAFAPNSPIRIRKYTEHASQPSHYSSDALRQNSGRTPPPNDSLASIQGDENSLSGSLADQYQQPSSTRNFNRQLSNVAEAAYQESTRNLRAQVKQLKEENASLQESINVYERQQKKLLLLPESKNNEGPDGEEIDQLRSRCLFIKKFISKCRGHELRCLNKGNKKGSIKNVKQEQRCYNEVVDFFEGEMAAISERLDYIQHLMLMSRENCKEETDALNQAICQLQHTNKQLVCQLSCAQENYAYEAEAHQMCTNAIGGLHEMLAEKSNDIECMDEEIQKHAAKVENVCRENEELKKEMGQKDELIADLRITLESFEANCNQMQDLHQQLGLCERRNGELEVSVQDQSLEIEQLKSQCAEYTEHLYQLRHDVEAKTMAQQDLSIELNQLKDKLQETLQQNEMMKHELVAKQQIQDEHDLCRNYLLDLNNKLLTLVKSNLPDSESTNTEDGSSMEDESLFEKCDNTVKTLKQVLQSLHTVSSNAVSQLAEMQHSKLKLQEEHAQLKAQYHQLRSAGQKQLEDMEMSCQCLQSKLSEHVSDRSRLSQMVSALQAENLRLCAELNCTKENKSEMCNVQQRQIDELQSEIEELLRKQNAALQENAELRSQLLRVDGVEERCRVLRSTLDQYVHEIQILRQANDDLSKTNNRRTNDLDQLRDSYNELEAKHRYTQLECAQLQGQLFESIAVCNSLCDGSLTVLECARMWTDEQNRLNKAFFAHHHVNSGVCDTVSN